MRLPLAALFCLILFWPARSQVRPPNPTGVSLGHLHFHSDSPVAHAKFWTTVFGAQPIKLGDREVYRLPGVFIVVDRVKPTGGMEDSTIPSIGLKVRDLKNTLAKVKAANARIANRNRSHAVVIGPDDIQVELTADRSLGTSVASEAIHLNLPDPAAAMAWYAKTFAAIQEQGNIAMLPGANLDFSKSATVPAGTKGRVLDHIGFEVKDLEAFCKNLEAGGAKFDIAYRKIPQLGISIAFITDPWGTYIELTEGLDKL